MLNVLIVHESEKQRLELGTLIEDELAADEVKVTLARTATVAQHYLDKSDHGIDVLIIQDNLRSDERRSPKEGVGADLARKSTDGEATLGIVLITNLANRELFDEAQSLGWWLAFEGRTLENQIVNGVQALKGGKQDDKRPPRKKTGFVEIWIEAEKGQGKYCLSTNCVRRTDSGPLEYKAIPIKELQLLSNIINDEEDLKRQWREMFGHIGDKVQDIVLQNPELRFQFQNLLEAVGGFENIELEFFIDRDAHDIPFESVKRWDHNDHLMLTAPVYRRIDIHNPAERLLTPLFENDEPSNIKPLNCLIIDASTDGIVPDLYDENGKPIQLDPMGHGPAECEKLEQQLTTVRDSNATSRVHLGAIERISRQQGRSFKNDCQQKLKEREWDVVHFCGHSFYDRKKRKGYIVVPDKYNEAISIQLFAKWIRRTKFLYLNSCRSSERGFVYELAKQKIAAILGFRWKISDEYAKEFALNFYDGLLGAGKPESDTPSLKRAFLRAQSDMHVKHEEDRIWAAPMLVLQRPGLGARN